jgi:hypothetical protein
MTAKFKCTACGGRCTIESLYFYSRTDCNQALKGFCLDKQRFITFFEAESIKLDMPAWIELKEGELEKEALVVAINVLNEQLSIEPKGQSYDNLIDYIDLLKKLKERL